MGLGADLIYQPRAILDLRLAIGLGIFRAALRLLADFIAQDNEPWAYYVGAALGEIAVATGGLGAVATMYVVADTLDMYLLHSADGSEVKVFVDGIEDVTIDTFTGVGPEWRLLNLIGLGAGIIHRVDIVNFGPSSDPNATGIPWLAIGPVTIPNGYALEAQGPMALYNISYSVLDSDGDVATLPVKVKAETHTIAQIQEAASDLALLIDTILDGQVTAIAITLDATLPGGLKAVPVAGCENQRGALFSFTLDGSPYRHSIRLPAFKEALFTGKAVNTADTAVAAFVTAVTTGVAVTGPATVEPANPFEFEYGALVSAIKSFRK